MMSQPERPALRPVSLPADWTPASWRERTALQQPSYPDQDVLAGVQDELRALPPLVTSWEIAALKQQLADAQERSEEHTSELQSLMRISYAVFCLKKKRKMSKYKINQPNEI